MQARGSINPSRFAGWGFSLVPSRSSVRTSLSKQSRCLTQKPTFAARQTLPESRRSFTSGVVTGEPLTVSADHPDRLPVLRLSRSERIAASTAKMPTP